MILDNKHTLVTGGTGSLGKTIVFSRDEAKQRPMRVDFHRLGNASEEAIYARSREILVFQIGDVRDYDSVCRAIQDTRNQVERERSSEDVTLDREKIRRFLSPVSPKLRQGFMA